MADLRHAGQALKDYIAEFCRLAYLAPKDTDESIIGWFIRGMYSPNPEDGAYLICG